MVLLYFKEKQQTVKEETDNDMMMLHVEGNTNADDEERVNDMMIACIEEKKGIHNGDTSNDVTWIHIEAGKVTDNEDTVNGVLCVEEKTGKVNRENVHDMKIFMIDVKVMVIDDSVLHATEENGIDETVCVNAITMTLEKTLVCHQDVIDSGTVIVLHHNQVTGDSRTTGGTVSVVAIIVLCILRIGKSVDT